MPRRTRGAGGAFFSRTKKQRHKNAFSFVTCKGEEYEHLLLWLGQRKVS
jgi:coproporphyrinogen III oxidase